ncbi:MAG: DUF692 domain-containing protein [Spirochaetia bacterium]|nr:DUF692 domain-containing protein [Spirochaetia bacterium]
MKLDGISNCGIGLRREFLREFKAGNFKPDWIEITPENWIHMPFKMRNDFYEIISSNKIIAHGLSLSIGSPEPVNFQALAQLKTFLNENQIEHYSEHLSFSSWHGSQTYELLPVPMTIPMADFIADKIKIVSDFLQRPVIMENAAYYYIPYAEMPEQDFINMVINKADCLLLLDVNNVYVNSINHKFNPMKFISALDLDRVAYIHTAGHTYYPEQDILIDTHGAPVVDEVWGLLRYALEQTPAPAMIERDNNIPPLSEIISEYNFLQQITSSYYPTLSKDRNFV